MALSISRRIFSSLLIGRLARNSSRHSSRNASSALFSALGLLVFVVKRHDQLAPLSISFKAASTRSFFQFDGGARAGVHHLHVRDELVERPDDVLAVGVLAHEGEQFQVALRVARDGGIILQLEQAQVAVVILDALLLQFAAFVGGKLVGLAFLFGGLRRGPGGRRAAIRNSSGACRRAGRSFPSGSARGRAGVGPFPCRRCP